MPISAKIPWHFPDISTLSLRIPGFPVGRYTATLFAALSSLRQNAHRMHIFSVTYPSQFRSFRYSTTKHVALVCSVQHPHWTHAGFFWLWLEPHIKCTIFQLFHSSCEGHYSSSSKSAMNVVLMCNTAYGCDGLSAFPPGLRENASVPPCYLFHHIPPFP